MYAPAPLVLVYPSDRGCAFSVQPLSLLSRFIGFLMRASCPDSTAFGRAFHARWFCGLHQFLSAAVALFWASCRRSSGRGTRPGLYPKGAQRVAMRFAVCLAFNPLRIALNLAWVPHSTACPSRVIFVRRGVLRAANFQRRCYPTFFVRFARNMPVPRSIYKKTITYRE